MLHAGTLETLAAVLRALTPEDRAALVAMLAKDHRNRD
jgi:hypothetical protein